MANNSLDFMKDVLAAPLGEVISSVGQGVADAQASLDAASLRTTLEIYSENDDEGIKLLREIGYRPTFYAIPETIVETHISLSISSQAPQAPSAGGTGSLPSGSTPTARTAVPKLYATPVNASMSNRYNFTTQASTKMTFKIVPVPPTTEVSDIRVAPDLAGKTIAEVETLLGELTLTYNIANPEAEGTGAVVDTQDPSPGALMQAGNTIEITLV